MNISLVHLFMESRGGINRTHIVNLISKMPSNNFQISKKLNLNYKTVKHHLQILEENKVVTCDDKAKYGSLYAISDGFNIDLFTKIYNACIKDCSPDDYEIIRENVMKMLK